MAFTLISSLPIFSGCQQILTEIFKITNSQLAKKQKKISSLAERYEMEFALSLFFSLSSIRESELYWFHIFHSPQSQ